MRQIRRYKRWLSIAAVILVALGVNLDQFGIDLKSWSGQPAHERTSDSEPQIQNTSQTKQSSGSKGKHWSSTDPEINLWHIFDGEINRKGKPTGFHSRPNGADPENARVVRIKDKPNRAGVYTATVEVRDGGRWKEKFSSFFPDTMSREEVIDAILNAYNNSDNQKKQPWSGPSSHGFQIQGYTTGRGGVNTAFPVYRKNQ